jgi:hypothetical protein
MNMMWKDTGVEFQHLPKGTERKHEKLNQRMLSPDLNQRASK